MEESLIKVNVSPLDTNHNATSSLVSAGMKGWKLTDAAKSQAAITQKKTTITVKYSSMSSVARRKEGPPFHHHLVTTHLNSVSSVSLLKVNRKSLG